MPRGVVLLVWVSGASLARAEPPPLPPTPPAQETPESPPAPESPPSPESPPAPAPPPEEAAPAAPDAAEPEGVGSTPPEAAPPPSEQPPAPAPPTVREPPAVPAASLPSATQEVAAENHDEPRESTDRSSLVLPEGAFAFASTLEVGHIDLGEYGQVTPVTFAPDFWFGLTDHITVGAVTSTVALSGFWTRSQPGGLCLSSCSELTVGADGLIAILRGDLQLAAAGGFDVLREAVFGKGGLKALAHLGRFSASASPSFLANLSDSNSPYARIVQVPVDLTMAISPRVSLGVQSGFEWIHFHDGYALANMYTVPVGFAASLNLSRVAVTSIAFAFDHAAQAGGTELDDMGLASQWSIALSLMTVVR